MTKEMKLCEEIYDVPEAIGVRNAEIADIERSDERESVDTCR